MSKIMQVLIGAVILCGVFAGFGAWAVVGFQTMISGTVAGFGNPTVGEHLLGFFTMVFFGGIATAAAVTYVSYVRDLFKRKSL